VKAAIAGHSFKSFVLDFRVCACFRVATVNDDRISGNGSLGGDLRTGQALMELSSEVVG
jgi:hypothetical protein